MSADKHVFSIGFAMCSDLWVLPPLSVNIMTWNDIATFTGMQYGVCVFASEANMCVCFAGYTKQMHLEIWDHIMQTEPETFTQTPH